MTCSLCSKCGEELNADDIFCSIETVEGNQFYQEELCEMCFLVRFGVGGTA